MGLVTLYKANDGWRWHRTVSSDVVAESGEGYEGIGHAEEQARANAQPGDTLKIVFEDGSTQETALPTDTVEP